jgi:hypothetical protein
MRHSCNLIFEGIWMKLVTLCCHAFLASLLRKRDSIFLRIIIKYVEHSYLKGYIPWSSHGITAQRIMFFIRSITLHSSESQLRLKQYLWHRMTFRSFNISRKLIIQWAFNYWYSITEICQGHRSIMRNTVWEVLSRISDTIKYCRVEQKF